MKHLLLFDLALNQIYTSFFTSMIITIILPTDRDEVILTTACTKKNNKLPSPYIQFYMSHDTGKKQAD